MCIQDKIFEVKVLTDEVAILNDLTSTLQQDKTRLLNQLTDHTIDIKVITRQLLTFQGNIRVICRIKSQLKSLTSQSGHNYDPSDPSLVTDEDETYRPKYRYDIEKLEYNQTVYPFDRVFEPFAGHDEVFTEV